MSTIFQRPLIILQLVILFSPNLIWPLLRSAAALPTGLFQLPQRTAVVVNESFYWDINTQKGIMRGQNLKLRKLNHPSNPYHTCYEITCENVWSKHCPEDSSSRTIRVCYPAIIVTGFPKCGTSAMYEVLSQFPGAVTMSEKENCPSTRRRPHWIYFNSLPRMDDIGPRSLIIDGCIDIEKNMKIRTLIEYPEVYYLVMVRDYADMVWSSYNFYCKREYDGVDHCGYEKWASAEHHRRSPRLFHDLIAADANHTTGVVQPFYYPMVRPCINAGGYYFEQVEFFLHRNGLQNHTIVVASEELDAFPLQVAERVARILQYDISGISLQRLDEVRINSQEDKGASHAVSMAQYQPGLYRISGYQPMLRETRELLNRCWREDCLRLAALSPYRYDACFDEQRHLHERVAAAPLHEHLPEADNALLADRRHALRVSMPWRA